MSEPAAIAPDHPAPLARSTPCVHLGVTEPDARPWCQRYHSRHPADGDCIDCPDYAAPEYLRTRCEVWTRVMGYHRPVHAFNKGKQSEHADRCQMTETAAAASPHAAPAAIGARDPAWETCGDCPSLAAPDADGDTPCLRLTVPMGEGCLRHRDAAAP